MPDNRVVSDQIEPQMPMWSTHNPACDQCRSKKQRCERQRPICRNCKRLNLVCEYSGRGKKPNQNTELMRRLRRAEGHINSLETSLSRIQPYLERIEAESVLLKLPTTGDLFSASTASLELESFEWPQSPPEAQQESLEERDSITYLAMACTKIAMEIFKRGQPLDGVDIKTTVMRPPLFILQAMVPTYFDMLNDSFPMFSKHSIEDLMEQYEDYANASQNVAHSLCFNHIILLTLMAKVQRRLAQDAPAVMDLELVKTFMENAFGAFRNLESLLYPTVANLQALLSLSLVCQSMCLTDLARRSIQLTHTLWRLLDLQSSTSQKSPHQPAIAEEHINLFWCIFILETSVPMNASRRILSSVVTQMPLPLEQSANHGRYHFLAAIHVARLRHDVLVTGTAFPPVRASRRAVVLSSILTLTPVVK